MMSFLLKLTLLFGKEFYFVDPYYSPNGKKKAFIKLAADSDALEVASKIGTELHFFLIIFRYFIELFLCHLNTF